MNILHMQQISTCPGITILFSIQNNIIHFVVCQIHFVVFLMPILFVLYHKIGGDILNFGDVLRELLENSNLSQKKMAEDLNISASAVGNYVRNNREPDFETLKKIAGYFHVSIDFLLSYSMDSKHPDYRDQKLLQIFHALTEEQKELYIEQGNLFIKSNQKKKQKLSSSGGENRGDSFRAS